jgi:hypothetical protein
LRHLRCYLKHYPKWKHYDLSIDKQRELILNCEVLGCEEEYVEEVISYDRNLNTSNEKYGRGFLSSFLDFLGVSGSESIYFLSLQYFSN